MSINYKIKLYYRVIGGPYHCCHHCCSRDCCQLPSFLSSHSLVLTLQLCPHPPQDLIMDWFLFLSHPPATVIAALPRRVVAGSHRCVVVQELEL